MRRRALALAALAAAVALLSVACGGSGELSQARAEEKLRAAVVPPEDAGPDFTQDLARVQTNDESARARPDTEQARKQYEEWRQVLAYRVQYSAPATPDLVFSGRTAQIMNTATIFETPDGAAASMAYVRALPESTVADFLINEGGGTKISDTQVVKDVDFPQEGDESFAWRSSGKATFADGFTVNFVADTVFVRAGRITGAITTVALGQPPDRAELETLVGRFVARAQRESARAGMLAA
ncbi:MAG TPA: hypothetical protein VFC53_12570 [Dehalococcoidia bacterium]|nr:hypothetical protein [Dehalococcoidia bacterium]